MKTKKFLCPLFAIALLTLPNQTQAHGLPQAEANQALENLRSMPFFACAHEQFSPASKEVESIFRYGQFLEQSGPIYFNNDNVEKYNEIVRYYRIAAAENYYPAQKALLSLLHKYRPDSDYYTNARTSKRRQHDTEIEQLEAKLLQQKSAAGYFAQAENDKFLRKIDEAIAAYYKAAIAGHAEAQLVLANYLNEETSGNRIRYYHSPDKAWLRARELYQCAAGQGSADAWGYFVAIELRNGGDERIMPLLQRAVMGGSPRAAYLLSAIFEGKSFNQVMSMPKKMRRRFNIQADPERAKRYEAYRSFLISNQDEHFVIPDVNKYVPLPPAPLPEWDGVLPKQKPAIAIVARPSEALIEQLCQEKNLDPASGRAMH